MTNNWILDTYMYLISYLACLVCYQYGVILVSFLHKDEPGKLEVENDFGQPKVVSYLALKTLN